MVLLCALCASLLYAAQPVKKKSNTKQQRKQTSEKKEDPERVYLIHSDELFYDQWRNNNAQVLRGNVHFLHDGAHLYCDSANFFEETNSFEAFGHVYMNQGDNISRKAEK